MTLIVAVAFTLLIVCLVYKIKAKREKRSFKAETPSIVSASEGVVYSNPGNIQSTEGDPQVTMQPNPAYGMPYQKD